MSSGKSAGHALSRLDGLATGMSDLWLLIGRLLLAAVFLLTVVTSSPNAGYLTSLHYPAPDFWSMVAIAAEWIISITLILGVATRYGVALALIYTIIAVATAHRYWEYPQAQQGV